MLLAAATVLIVLLSVLAPGFLVILIGDAVERRRDPSRGLATCRAMRVDTELVVAALRRRLASTDVDAAFRRWLRALNQRAELRKG